MSGKDGDVEVMKKKVFNSHDFTKLRQSLVQKTIEQEKAKLLPKENDEKEQEKTPTRMHQSCGKMAISADNKRGAEIKKKEDDLGNFIHEVCEYSTHVGKATPIGSLVHKNSLLDPKIKLMLFGDIPISTTH